MSDRFEVKITGSNQASQAFQSVTRDMETLGRTAETTTRRMGMSFEDFNRRAFAIGATVGAATLALGEFSRAAVEDEAGQARLQQAVENTGKSYDDYSIAVERAIDAGEKKRFADDQVREALVRLNTVTNDTQVSLDKMGLVMDLARQRGISLSQAADIIAKVMGGNLGILARYGFQLDENATKEEALALIQQRVAGQAATYAQTNLGWLEGQKIRWDELTESIGAHTGALQEVFLLLPGLTAGYTALAGAITGLGGLGALGRIAPYLGAAAIGGTLAYGYYQDGSYAGYGTTTANSLANQGFAAAGDLLNWAIPFVDPYNTQKYRDLMASNSVEDVIKQLIYLTPSEANFKPEQAFPAKLDLLDIVPSDMSGDGDYQRYIIEQATAAGMSVGEWLSWQLSIAPGAVRDPVTGRYNTVGSNRIQTQWRADAISGANNVNYVGSPGTSGLARAAGIDTTNAPYFPFREGANPQADAALYSAERQRILAQIDQAALDFISNPGNVSQLLNNWQVMPDAPVFNRRGGGAGAGGGSSTPFYMAASDASTARDQFETGYRVTIGQTQQIASQSQGLSSFAEDLVNYEGVIGRVDDLLNRGVISIDAYRTAQEDANQIFAANAEIQDDVASIQVKQLGYNAEMLSQYAETIDAIEQMGEAEQRRALAMMDSGEAAKVNEAATIAYRVAMGELSETIGTDLIEGMARADPLLADLLEQYGLIEQGADGEIRVIFPEKQNLMDGIADLSQSIQDLVDAIYEVVIKGDNSQAIESIDEAWNEVRGLDGASATVKVYADISSAWSSLTALANTAWSTTVYAGVSASNPSGGSRLHGGVVGYANGGVVARMAEAGPELLRFRDGGTAWAMQDGLYNVPRGTYVTPAPASKGQGRSAPSIVIQNLNLYSNDPRDMVRQINEYARGGSRL